MVEPIPLLTLLTRVKRALALNFPTALWVRGELTQLNERRGNRYLQLSEKGNDSSIVARVDGHIWASDYARVLRSRGGVAGDVLALGREVCLQIEVDHHEVYGLRLRVVDWDPAFTLGQLELERREILARLEREGLLTRNRQHTLPPVLQRLAVLTSAAAAGLADFRHQLLDNDYGYSFTITHVDVAVQGIETEPSVIAALSQIQLHQEQYDVVCIIRGGGGRLDLASFDRYGIGAAIADCPLPVYVGIGHETDETVPDYVAHTAFKTPTAVAEAVIAHNARYEALMLQLGRGVGRLAQQLTSRENQLLQRLESQVEYASRTRVNLQTALLNTSLERLRLLASQAFAKTQQQLDATSRELVALDPASVLKRGFTFTTLLNGGRIVPAQLSSGDGLKTYFANGLTIDSKVI